jgi:hypothetical protein
MKTTLWTDPLTGRVAYFSSVGQPTPAVVSTITATGVQRHVLADLDQQVLDGPLPPPMLPQVCWLYRWQGSGLEFAPQLG